MLGDVGQEGSKGDKGRFASLYILTLVCSSQSCHHLRLTMKALMHKNYMPGQIALSICTHNSYSYSFLFEESIVKCQKFSKADAIGNFYLKPIFLLGQKGEIGPPGENGESGFPGFFGKRGPKGNSGDLGNPGEEGEVGDEGPAGNVDFGDKGLPGENGVKVKLPFFASFFERL